MEKNNKTLNVPHLRFPEFSGEWEKCMIGDVLKVGNGKDYKHLAEGDIPVFGTGGYMLSVNDFLYEGGSVFIGRKGTINKPFFYSGKFWTVDTLFYTHSFNKVIPHFVYGLFQRVNWNNYNEASGVPSLSKSTIEKIPIAIPSIEEQQKISSLLSLLDQRIETQKKIIEKYESLIRELCEKLTRQGTPNKTITECLECHSSTLQESAVLDAGSYPVYGAIGICGHADTPDVSGDGILIIKDGASVGVTYFADGSYSFIGTLNRLTAKEDINLRYVYYCLKVLNFTPYKTGLAIPHIYFKDYGKHKIWCPTLEQQSRIANALTTIDDKIQVEKSLLEQLNSQKRYMLNQLFI